MLRPKKISKRESRASITTIDVPRVAEKAGNIYEVINIVAKRARFISTVQKDELQQKIADFATSSDNLEEIFENREQIEISRHYERLPKATIVALEEFMEDKLVWKYPDEDSKGDNW
jgi:DNA-directed RNA polymerase subunit K/omega